MSDPNMIVHFERSSLKWLHILHPHHRDEVVVLSDGTLLQLQWSVHANTATGGTIMKAQVPPSVNLGQFNDLYIDQRAKTNRTELEPEKFGSFRSLIPYSYYC
jgi:hypothetical protein